MLPAATVSAALSGDTVVSPAAFTSVYLRR
jgi:hypothetical protein